MRTRKLGNTDLEFSTIGLGTWAIGGAGWRFGWGEQDDEAAVAGIVKAVELGINWIDTAPVYGIGHSEVLVGRAIKELGNDRPLIATKCGRVAQPDGAIKGSLKRSSVMAECELSLQRLGLETIDLLQIHWPDPHEDIEEAWEAATQLVKHGKVRHIGVSNFNIGHLQRIQPIHAVASLQPPYSMIARDVELNVLPYCKEHQIGAVAYSPMGKGLLTGAFTTKRAEQLAEDDHRSRDPKFASPLLEINLALVEKLKPIAADREGTVAQLAVAWVLRREEVTSAIVGSRRPEQIESIVAAGDWELTEAEIARIEVALTEHAEGIAELGDIDTGRV